MMPPRMVLGIDPASPTKWDPVPSGIWVVPDPALQWGFDNRHHVYAGNTMILPAEEQEWRDNQHYRAYVRPTKEEDERAEA
jgi:hypothetical protein